jgi:hypothetical protein
MPRILLSCVVAAVLALPAASAAGARRHSAPGFLVVRGGAGDGGVTGRPVVTVAVSGFVIGRISQEGRVAIYHLGSGGGGPQATGADVARHGVRWHGVAGTEYRGSDFRFRAVGGVYRVVVRGAGIYVFAGGRGHAHVLGSAVYPRNDGEFSLDGGRFNTLPDPGRTLTLGAR